MSDLPVSRTDYDDLRDALAPFASAYYSLRHKPDSTPVLQVGSTMLTVADLRTAAEVYNHEPLPVVMSRRPIKLQPYSGRQD